MRPAKLFLSLILSLSPLDLLQGAKKKSKLLILQQFERP
jgi:hypothetical protein